MPRGAPARRRSSRTFRPTRNEPYLLAAQAGQLAAAGDLAGAKTALVTAVAKEPKDGIQLDLAIMRGEIALAERDNPGALAAFSEAVEDRAQRAYALRSRARVLRDEDT